MRASMALARKGARCGLSSLATGGRDCRPAANGRGRSGARRLLQQHSAPAESLLCSSMPHIPTEQPTADDEPDVQHKESPCDREAEFGEPGGRLSHVET